MASDCDRHKGGVLSLSLSLSLSLQGIPVDDLLLTRETTDQMADLAGNAMTSTIVGTCILAALLLGKEYLYAFDLAVPEPGAVAGSRAGDARAGARTARSDAAPGAERRRRGAAPPARAWRGRPPQRGGYAPRATQGPR